MTDQRFAATERTEHRRLREKGGNRRADLEDVLRSGFVCHLAFVLGGSPVCLPTVYGADLAQGRGILYLHGSVASRSLVESPSQEVCVTVTHVDGLVLARSVFEHGVSYRSAMVFGTPQVVTGPEEKLHGLHVLSEQAAPGQWDYARRPSRKELAATTVLRLALDEVSVKLSIEHPDDGSGPDGDLPVWAGKLPLRHQWGTPEQAPDLRAGIPLPAHVKSRSGTLADRPRTV